MRHAGITGWGKGMPPAVLSNADLSTFLDTDDEWIVSRTGMRERRVSHVSVAEMAEIACARALAAAGLAPEQIDLVILGCTLPEQICPNVASAISRRLGTVNAAAMDVNTACTSFSYALSTANALIRSGAMRRALVIGAELVSRCMDWDNRNVAVLFGDGCAAVVLEATDAEEGVLSERLGCYADARDSLDLRGMGQHYANLGIPNGFSGWNFDGQEIFKRAVVGMQNASQEALALAGKTIEEVDLVIPHQANIRIIQAATKRLGIPMERTVVTLDRYGNTSSSSIPLAFFDARENGRVKNGEYALMTGFGAGMTWASAIVKWSR